LPYNRKAIAPWSTEREQGIESATVDSNIETPQYLQPVVNTGSIDLNGNWIGVRTSDKLFTIDATHPAIPNGAAVLSPQRADHEYIDMTGYEDLFIALKVSNAGNFGITAIMGPDTYSFANLTPVDAAASLRFANNGAVGSDGFDKVLSDSAEGLTADVWNILCIQGRARNQKLLQFQIVNSSGGESDIDFAYLRMV
jgi:hypothetical protein